VGHEEKPRDPSTKSDAGGAPASESVSDYHPHLPPCGREVRSVLQDVSRPATPGTRPAQAHLFTDRKLDAISVAQQLSALRFFFLKTLKRPWMVEDMPIPERPIRLPEILSHEEVRRLLECAGSPLHRICLLMLYATGMRREELVRLKIGDIDSDRMLLRIRQGKGKKDRDVMLSPRLPQELRDYWRSANPKPKTYLFPGKGPHRNANVPIDSRSIFNAVQQAAKRAGIEQRVHPHTLRHCFATHLLESGARALTLLSAPITPPSVE
jgi:integrase/recombinase XerD